jgi:WD40 repeat protein
MPQSQPRNLRVVREITRRDILFSVARVPNTSRLFVGSSDNKVHALDASQATPPSQEFAAHGSYVTGVRLAGRTLLSISYDGRLIWWDTEQRRPTRTVEEAHSRWGRQLAVSPDGARVASVADDMVCRIWDVATGRRLHELRGHEERTPQNFASMLYCCEFSADGRYLATGDRVGRVVIWDTATWRQAGRVEAPTLYTWDGRQRIRSIGGVRGLAFSPDGRQLAVGGVGQIGNVDALQGPSRVEVFDWQQGRRVQEFTGPNGIINRLIWHPEGAWLLAVGGGGNGIALFHDVARNARVHQANLPMHVHDAVFNEDFTTLYAVGHNKIVVAELRG